MECDLFCPRYRMADRPDIYMWENMEGPGSTSSDVTHHMDNNTGPMTRPPPPMAHSGHGGHLFQSQPHSQPSTPAPPRHPGDIGGGPMGGGIPGTPTPTPVSNPTTSPLVVPQPMKPRTIKTYHCRMCDQEFPNKSEMTRHSKDVHGMEEKGHKCPKCFKSFPTSQQLAQHSLVHTNIRKFHCHYCEKSFKQLSHVQQHQRIHTGERPYKCTVETCTKAFAQLANLQQHLKNHDSRAANSDKKPYCCSTCDRRFATEASLNHHVTKLHSSLARPHDLICQVCEKHCSDEEKFFKHIHKYHPEYWRVFSGGRPLSDFIGQHEPRRREKPYSCPICHKRYSHETGYLKHMATHPESDPNLRLQLWSCPVCHKVFTKESYLLRHMEMKLDEGHAAELVILKKKLKIGTEKPIPHPQGSATLTSAMSMPGPRDLGEGTSREFGLLPHKINHDMIRPDGANTSPQRNHPLDALSAATFHRAPKPLDSLHNSVESLKFTPLKRDALRSPPPQPLSSAGMGAGTGSSPRASSSSSPGTPQQQHGRAPDPNQSQARPMSRSSEVYTSAARTSEENSPYQRVNDSAVPKDMSIRDMARSENHHDDASNLRRSNSDSSFPSRDPFGPLSNHDGLEYGRPPSHTQAFPRSPDSTYPPTSAYLPHPQGTLGNPGSFRPAVHGVLSPSYIPPSLHSPPYSSSPIGMPNPYIPTGAEMSERDVASALQHLARSATNSLYSAR